MSLDSISQFKTLKCQKSNANYSLLNTYPWGAKGMRAWLSDFLIY